ncbi:hypothetical protein C0033_08390 [Clostridium sp. chh4-2]|uniref:phage baseplate assembly protein V n=1 Tax=Clostridium sp. chh4-2 TaxID=2067550 RepID=UPI000CCE773C|nr:phage baseplate assembly protein V [Clostridium sp. chh4-2]PNV62569.1 hypothetical protein C0033_08390 [Clostridium sp. chh4-2]
MESIATAIVKENWNQEKPGYVKVEYTLGESEKCVTDWIPVMTPYGGSGYAGYHLPEVGSKVVLGFNCGREDMPIVLGCLSNGDDAASERISTEENTTKLIRMKSGYQIFVDEEEKKMVISDSKGENDITILEESGTVCIRAGKKLEFRIGDQIRMTMDKDKVDIAEVLTVTDGILMKGKSITEDPENEVSIKGRSVSVQPKEKISLNSTNVQVEGMQVKIKGNQVGIEGKAGAKIHSDGMMEVKGAIIKLN